ncbi:hypothetical protein SASPL_153578 [Salvia splendens]|uniref:Disease resistance protein RPM1 n=1 Tax=Salvia splendens TaxID=180675 RepID=A0A8X8VYK3_SALSN|nr:hypothetical protein SASPL_153578 [Salvia splendens]
MAYALLISLKHSLELLLDPGRSRIQVSSSELQPFYEDLCYLKSFFDKVKSLEDSISVEEVEKDIKDVLQNSRNLMESHLSDLVRSGSERSGDGSWFSRELVELKDNLRRLSNMLKAKENDLIGKQQLPTDVAVGVDVAVVSEIHQEIVGLEDEVRMLRQRLLDPDSRLQLVYIVGMFGIGKTTLAKEVCNDEYIRDKFTTRGIVRIGVEYKLEELLRELCEVLMGSECPSELEGIGKEIVLNMGGHPSALVEIGKCVSELPKTVESWMEYAQNIIWKTTIPKVVNAELPHHLKACLLYLGLLLPNYNIPASQLIKLWVAEGFIEPDADQNLDSIAEEYLEDLVSRGLVIVHERSYTGRIKTCGMIHKLIRDVCVTEAQQQKIFCIVNKDTSTKKQRRVSIQSDALLGMMAVSPFDPAVHAVEISSTGDVSSHLHRLESFKCAVTNPSGVAFSLEGFPSGLTKLTLGRCGFLWDEHSAIIIDQLPDLQVLKLRWNAFCGPRWEFGDAVYHSLKLLVLEDLSIEQLKAEPKNLPVLQKLVIRRCYYLKEIPSDMIDILTLKVIEVDDCGNSLVKSARLIQEEQADRRNDDLQVTIHSSSDDSSKSPRLLDSMNV